MASSLRKTLEESAIAFFRKYENASLTNDANVISRGLSSDCIRKFQPPSFCQAMGYPSDAGISNSAYQDRIAQGMQAWTVTKTEIQHFMIDVDLKRVAAQTTVSGKWKTGEDVKLDFAWFLYFSDDGKEVVRIIEYVDSPPIKEYYEKIQRILAAENISSTENT